MINMHLAVSWIRHRLKAKTRHGVHSPFVYRLVDEVIYNFNCLSEFSAIENLRKKLLSDNRTITITDLGAGSHVNNNRQKQVKQLARHALKPARISQLLYRIINDLKPQNSIELGTCLGITTAYLAKAAPRSKVITVEGCPQTASIAQENLTALHAANAELRIGNFDQLFPDILKQLETIDFVFIDGNHRKEATLDYFRQCLPKVNGNSLIIFDDIYWSKGMTEAWEEIKKHPDVTLTIDLFWIGLIYFRKGQAKEHFKIRF